MTDLIICTFVLGVIYALAILAGCQGRRAEGASLDLFKEIILPILVFLAIVGLLVLKG